MPAHNRIMKSELSALSRSEVRSPIVIHQPGKDRARRGREFGWPVAAHDVAEGYQRCVRGNNRSRPVAAADRRPVIDGIPLAATSSQFIAGGIDPSVLRLISECRTFGCKRKRDVDGFFGEHVLLAQSIRQIKALLPIR